MNLLFAWRYFRAKKSTNAINIIAWVSMSAIVVGAASLILVLSVFNGFEDLVKSLYTSFYPDIKVSPVTDKTMTLTPEQLHRLAGLPGIHAVSLVAQDRGILEENGDRRVPAFIKGVDSNYLKVSGVGNNIQHGQFELGTTDRPMTVLGSGIEATLEIQADRALLPLSVYLFRRGNTDLSISSLSSLSRDNMATAGDFRIQEDFDQNYAITNIGFVKRMIGLGPDEYTAAEISIDDPARAIPMRQIIATTLGNGYLVQTRYEQNQNLYNVMGTEKWVIYIVLSLILVVAAFNMVGALTMLVWEKQKDIHVLKALGASDGMIQKIFLSEGLLLGLMGGIGGILLAVIICMLQIKYHLIPLQGGSFLIDYYPVKLVATDFILVLSTIAIVALLASWLPARKAARTAIDLRS